jgi:hypothetical protein
MIIGAMIIIILILILIIIVIYFFRWLSIPKNDNLRKFGWEPRFVVLQTDRLCVFISHESARDTPEYVLGRVWSSCMVVVCHHGV